MGKMTSINSGISREDDDTWELYWMSCDCTYPLVRLGKDNTPQLFKPWLFSSQPYESYFKACRSFSPVGSTQLTFTLLDFVIHRCRKADAHIRLTSLGSADNIVYPRHIKNQERYGSLSEETYLCDTLPSLDEIKNTMEKARIRTPSDRVDNPSGLQCLSKLSSNPKEGTGVQLCTGLTDLEQRIGPTLGVKCNNNLSSAISRCGAHRRKLRTTFWHMSRASLNCESETRNAKRLKCGKAVRNGPKFWDRFAGPNAGGHTKERNILRNKKFSFSPQRSKLTEICRHFLLSPAMMRH
ncbi:hypothetical protein DAPPUDRAFT_304196 [Daphnia pulex]|uniref:Uncharacterized protein n=1 Tax=Daphnia pulex TaxID=6669 RepID=E9GJN6_DAPPU|nr:hypothetical protein DAPPUDRAFT_304196 [Daphnia pulex]|eukprot:EFX80144.1 hypothetical protein DAPPUDRAFT_304196 [Daphnia pulex]